MTAEVSHVPPADLVEDDPTSGIVRKRAIVADGLWAGTATTAAGVSSGWHHHGEHETAIYVVAGRLRLDWGPAGREVVEATAGDFVHVPAFAIHRESNPGSGDSQLVVVRAGEGAPTVNVDGPS